MSRRNFSTVAAHVQMLSSVVSVACGPYCGFTLSFIHTNIQLLSLLTKHDLTLGTYET